MEHNFRFKCCSFAAVTMKLLFPLVMLVCANFLPIDAADLCSPVNPCQNAGRCTSTGDTSYQCQCSTGYWGTNCTFFNPCSQAGACYNGATCSNVSSVTYVCRCPAGYVGAQCQTLDPCSPNPCGQSQCVFNEAASPQYRCVCTVGTTGPNCAQLDPCAQLPCQNGATCVSVSDGASYQCQCASGYQGTNCDWYNPCLTESSPCFNGATCSTPISGRFSCACPLGYYGSQCGEQNACLLNAASQNILCKHGDCISTGNTSYQCSCHAGWYGADCSQYNPCAVSPTPCLNQGTCSSPGSLLYQCLCPAGYYGVNCQFYNPCTAFPDGTLCFNGATCRNTTSGNYTCSCRQGYYGDSCSFYNPCWSSPCINGATCTNAVLNSFQCLCEAGFYGTLCGQLNGCFSSPCTNGATCTNTSDSGAFTCACAAGYRGPLCQTYDPCSGPGTQCIQNGGTCIQVTGGNGYACFCNTGFYGANCEYFNPCSSSPCSNGGTCSNMTNVIYSCQCQPAYSGLRCEIHSPCLLAPCQNGATCNDILTDPSITNGQFRCTCNAGYYGSHCELINGCLLSGDTVCLNGGICTNTTISGSITCSCEAGYYGSRCNDGFNPCVVGSGPCLNGAVCSNTTSGSFYVCTCIQGYYGDRCQNWNPCWRGPCLNGGQCRNLTNSTYSCDCIPPLLGSNCQNYDFCDVGVCQNGALSCTLSGVNLGFLDSTKLRNVSVQYGSGSVADVKIVNSFGCACAPGFTGLTCDADINECLSGPCFNAATCINTYGSYWCSCQSGFTGNNCQLDVNQCRSSPCFNGATCLNAVNAFSCKCAPGFTGAFCQTQINECLSSPCLNQGTCIDQVASFYCQCQPGYTGTICQSIINACQSNPCRNAGTCYNQTTACTDTSNCPLSPIAAGSFWCGCAVGFTGSQCQTEINECLSNPCQNGATCVDLVGSFRCDCPAGFTGRTCDVQVDECASVPCQHGGICLDYVNLFICVCTAGYRGAQCQLSADIDVCLPNPCYNSATCLASQSATNSQTAAFSCLCPVGYTGTLCDVIIDPCQSKPCFNSASCQSTGLTFNCVCGSSYTGRQCETAVCPANTCSNGGTCAVGLDGSFRCLCAAGYTGTRCELAIDPCSSNPCFNGGSCVSLTIMGTKGYGCLCRTGYSGQQCNDSQQVPCRINNCQNGATCFCRTQVVNDCYCACPVAFTGALCESITDGCVSSPCRNGGSCFSSSSDTGTGREFVCACPAGYTGRACDSAVDFCRSLPCLNGAVSCTSVNGTFLCQCAAGYTGNQCETNINECQSSPCVNGGTCTDSVNRFQCSCPIGYYGDNCAIIGSCSDSTTVSDYGTFQWPFTLAQSNSSVAYLPCPYGPSSTSISSSSSVASRVCSSQLASAVWLDPDYSRCRLSDLAIANYTLYDYDKTTSYPSTLTADQVSQIADGLLAVVKYVTPSQQPLLAIMLMNIVDHLTQVNQSVMQDSQAVNQTADKLLNLVSKFTRDVVFPLSASSYGLLYRTLNYSIVHVDAVIIDVNVTAYRAIGEDNSTAPAQISVNSSVRTSSVTVSLSPVLNYTAEQRLVTVFYANDLFYRPLKLAKPYVTSDVISVTLSNVTSSDASDEQLVTLSIRLQPELMKYTLIECAYWNPLDHEWSTSGVTTILGENRLVTCQSQHLSSFTVVTANETEVEAFTVPETVTYISYIGCGVCMGCVLTTLIIYCLLQFAESNKFGKIWINVCLAILLLNVFFVVASRWLLCNTAGCTALTYLFHVFLLASFLWLLIDIVGFYQKVVTDFITYEKHFLIGRILAGWGFPLVAAAVTLIIDVVQYEPASIYCRTPLQRPSVFYVTFLGYVCLAVLVGILVFVGTLVAIARRKDNDPRVIIHQIASTPVILCLSGAAWIIGLLAARFGGLGLEVAFCIVNSISGLAILIDRGIVEQREILLHPCLSSGDNDSMDSTEAAIAQGRRRHHSTDSIDSFGSQSPGGVVGRTILSSGRRDTHDVFATSAIITPASGNHNGGRWGRWPASRKKDNEQMKYGRPDVHITGTLRRNETSDEHEAVKSKPTVSGANDVNQPAAAPNNGTYRIITTTDVNNETLTYI